MWHSDMISCTISIRVCTISIGVCIAFIRVDILGRGRGRVVGILDHR